MKRYLFFLGVSASEDLFHLNVRSLSIFVVGCGFGLLLLPDSDTSSLSSPSTKGIIERLATTALAVNVGCESRGHIWCRLLTLPAHLLRSQTPSPITSTISGTTVCLVTNGFACCFMSPLLHLPQFPLLSAVLLAEVYLVSSFGNTKELNDINNDFENKKVIIDYVLEI